MSILVTGGAGYIGSHTCIELLEAGYQVVVVDNLCNSSKKSLERVQEITGKELTFYQDDLLDSEALDAIFQRESIDAVIHFAGLKAVGESVQKPLEYYHNNLTGTFILLEKMKKYQVKNFVFSSSATVYGSPKSVPIREDFPLHVTNPYGRTKLILEEVLTDVHTADPAFNVILLRYFNPIGAHRSGRIGENPKGIPNNLLPYITQVAIGKLPKINVFGDDYDTPDGTGVRDTSTWSILPAAMRKRSNGWAAKWVRARPSDSAASKAKPMPTARVTVWEFSTWGPAREQACSK